MDDKKDKDLNIRHQEKSYNGQFLSVGNHVSLIKNADEFVSLRRGPLSSFVQKKSEKLATAVYMITGFLSDNEPLKWTLRKMSLSIMSDISSITQQTSDSSSAAGIKNIVSDIEKISSFIGIARIAGFVSEMNAAILHDEYLSLAASAAEEQGSSSQKDFVFSHTFFTDGAPAKKETFAQNSMSREVALKDKNSFVLNKDLSRPQTSAAEVRPQERKILSDGSPKKLEKNSRRETVIALVKEKGEVSIKDIVSHFTEYGEKTIQRELLALVADGVLKKEGDRRWSKYSIA